MKQLMKLLIDNRKKGFFKSEAVVNASNQDEATIYLYDMIVSDDLTAEWYGGVSPQAFVKALANVTAKTIHLRINSPGGDVFAARSIEQALREHPSNIVAHIDGVAASAASFLAMAADEIVMNEGAFLMIHKASTLAYGNSDSLLETANLLHKIDESLINTYAKRSGKGIEDIAQWMSDETWFSAEEAITQGFADRIHDGSAPVKNEWDMSAYKNSPIAQAHPLNFKASLPADLSARQVDLYRAFEKVADDFGKFDQSSNSNGSHYVFPADNVFATSGMKCSNCALFEGPRACEIVDGDIDPDSICKFWIIPESLLVKQNLNTEPPAQAVQNVDHLKRKLQLIQRGI